MWTTLNTRFYNDEWMECLEMQKFNQASTTLLFHRDFKMKFKITPPFV